MCNNSEILFVNYLPFIFIAAMNLKFLHYALLHSRMLELINEIPSHRPLSLIWELS